MTLSDTLFFILSKTVWFVIRPESWIILGVGVAFLSCLRRRRGLALWAGGLTFALMLLVAVLPLGEWAIRPLEARYPVAPAVTRVDGVILLGGSEDAAGTAYWDQSQFGEAGERYTTALALARRFPQAQVIFTGGSGLLRDTAGRAVSESDVARRFFAEQGLAADRLTLESQSRTTAENARLTLALIRPDPAQRWLLVTSAHHMPRAMESFRAAGWQGVTAWPVDFRYRPPSRSIGWDFARNLDTLNTAIREYVGLVAYRLTGR